MIQTFYMIHNPYYYLGRYITVEGFFLHSVGVGQPDPWVFIRQFNTPNYERACVHGFIGADETIITMPCLVTPGRAMRAPHAGNSWSNNRYLGFEMTEPKGIKYTGRGAEFVITDKAGATAHAWATIRRAVDLFAQLCAFHNLDPLADGVILGHYEGSARGIASAHADPEHLWRGLGMNYNMDQFREDVAAAVSKLDTREEENDMTEQEVIDIVKKQKTVYETIEEVPEWARPTVRKLMGKGILQGDGSGLGLTYDLTRVLVINDRAGLYE